jgi:hypothetical protein
MLWLEMSHDMQASIEGNVWKFWGQPGSAFYQRFEDKFSDDGNTISGRFEKSIDRKNWEVDFDTKYTRIQRDQKQ